MPNNKFVSKSKKDMKASSKPKDLRDLIEERRNKGKKDKKPVQKGEKKLELFTSHFKKDRAPTASDKNSNSKGLRTDADRWKKNSDVEVDLRPHPRNMNSKRELSPIRKEVSRRDVSPKRDTRNQSRIQDRYEISPLKEFRNARDTRNRYEDSPIRESSNLRQLNDSYDRSPSRYNRTQDERGPTSVLIGNIANYLSSTAVSNWLSQHHPVNEVKMLYYKDKDQPLKQSRFAEAIFATEKGAQASVELLNNFDAENGTISLEVVENGISRKY